ncbi:hypothetical protein F5878DRAFT_647820, partial [Lentinula raphanica]
MPTYSFPSTFNSASSGPVPMDLDTFTPAKKFDKTKVRCYNCNKHGHFARECRMPHPRPLHPGRSRMSIRSLLRPSQDTAIHKRTPQPSAGTSQASPQTVDDFLSTVKKESSVPPLSLNLFTLDMGDTPERSLPIYAAAVSGRPSRFKKSIISSAVDVIADTGAQDNYIRSDVVKKINAEYYPLDEPRSIAGAGKTTTRGFARFKLKIGTIEEEIGAYVLDKNTGFRYDILLGRTFLGNHNVIFDWKDNTLRFHSSKTNATIVVQAIPNPKSLPVKEIYTTNIKEGSDESLVEGKDLLSSEDNDESDFELVTSPEVSAKSGVKEEDDEEPAEENETSKLKKLGLKLKEMCVQHFPKCFRKKPVKIRGRPHSPRENLEIKKFVDEALADGVIEPSTSPWSAPIILVPKKNGSQIFTTLDLKSGYWQVPIAEEDRQKTAFTCRY